MTNTTKIVGRTHSRFRKLRYGTYKRGVLQNFIKKTKPSPLRFTILQRLKEVDIRETSPFSLRRHSGASYYIRGCNTIVLAQYAAKDILVLLHELFHRTEVLPCYILSEKTPSIALWSAGKEVSHFISLASHKPVEQFQDLQLKAEEAANEMALHVGNLDILKPLFVSVFNNKHYSTEFNIDVSGEWYETKPHAGNGFGPIFKAKVWWSSMRGSNGIRMLNESIVDIASYSAYLHIIKKHNISNLSYYGAVNRYVFRVFGEQDVGYVNNEETHKNEKHDFK